MNMKQMTFFPNWQNLVPTSTWQRIRAQILAQEGSEFLILKKSCSNCHLVKRIQLGKKIRTNKPKQVKQKWIELLFCLICFAYANFPKK